MVKIVSKRLSILHIHMGEIIVEVSRIYDEDRSKIDREILDKVAKARFGEGNYELKDRDTYWRLESPSPLTQVSSCS